MLRIVLPVYQTIKILMEHVRLVPMDRYLILSLFIAKIVRQVVVLAIGGLDVTLVLFYTS